jgi:ABC-type amino acid transport system permease subunit
VIGVGLLHTFEGRLGICVAALVLGTVATIVLSLFRGLMHRQTIREFGRWCLLFAGFCMAPPLLVLIAVTSVEVVRVTPVWVWPLLVAVVLGVVGSRLVLRHRAPVEVTPVRSPLMAEPGWSLPADVEQWDR